MTPRASHHSHVLSSTRVLHAHARSALTCDPLPLACGGASGTGDFDFLSLHGIIYPLEQVQDILQVVLHARMPASVDSACVAGMLDLLRTAGMWRASVRYGYLFGALSRLKGDGNLAVIAQRGLLWKSSALTRATAIFESAWEVSVASCPPSLSLPSPRSAASLGCSLLLAHRMSSRARAAHRPVSCGPL